MQEVYNVQLAMRCTERSRSVQWTKCKSGKLRKIFPQLAEYLYRLDSYYSPNFTTFVWTMHL